MPFIIHQGMLLYKEPLNFIENPMVWFVIVFFGVIVLMKEIITFSALEKARRLEMEKEGLVFEKPQLFAWYTNYIKYWGTAKPKEEVEIILDHDYDGIRELDNSLPPWWKNLFYLSIIFAIIYLVRYEVFDGETQIDEYNEELAIAKKELEMYKTTAPDTFDIENATQLTDAADLKRGNAVYTLNCASCHSADGGGGIGPNLVDEYWILGGGMKNVVHTLLNGGRTGKGMIAWDKTLKPEDIAKVASYVLSLDGTTPANPKAAEGEIWVDDAKEKKVVDETVLEDKIIVEKADGE